MIDSVRPSLVKNLAMAALRAIRLVGTVSEPSRMRSREVAVTVLPTDEALLRLRSRRSGCASETEGGLGGSRGACGRGTIDGAVPNVTGPLVEEGGRDVEEDALA